MSGHSPFWKIEVARLMLKQGPATRDELLYGIGYSEWFVFMDNVDTTTPATLSTRRWNDALHNSLARWGARRMRTQAWENWASQSNEAMEATFNAHIKGVFEPR